MDAISVERLVAGCPMPSLPPTWAIEDAYPGCREEMRSEGFEYPPVVIPVVTQHFTMLARSLLYTGVTRGKRPVVLVGQTTAVAVAVRGRNTKRRWTRLREWLIEAP